MNTPTSAPTRSWIHRCSTTCDPSDHQGDQQRQDEGTRPARQRAAAAGLHVPVVSRADIIRGTIGGRRRRAYLTGPEFEARLEQAGILACDLSAGGDGLNVRVTHERVPGGSFIDRRRDRERRAGPGSPEYRSCAFGQAP
jgi:hypothetical protein